MILLKRTLGLHSRNNQSKPTPHSTYVIRKDSEIIRFYGVWPPSATCCSRISHQSLIEGLTNDKERYTNKTYTGSPKNAQALRSTLFEVLLISLTRTILHFTDFNLARWPYTGSSSLTSSCSASPSTTSTALRTNAPGWPVTPITCRKEWVTMKYFATLQI